jgi:hypothetical protein
MPFVRRTRTSLPYFPTQFSERGRQPFFPDRINLSLVGQRETGSAGI